MLCSIFVAYSFTGSVFQWIESQIPILRMQVRFLPGSLLSVLERNVKFALTFKLPCFTMSFLKDKSEFNRKSASLLQDENFHCSAIHCSYYSCIQLMIHLLLFKLNYSEIDLKPDEKLGSHEKLINILTEYMKEKGMDWSYFNQNIVELKKLRVKSDYRNSEIISKEGNNSIILADRVTKTLSTNIL